MERNKKVLFAMALIASLSGGVLSSGSATAQDSAALPPVENGTCCTEQGSDCIVGTVIRENKYYVEQGPCGG